MLPRLVELDFPADIVTDQTSAHDPLTYVPAESGEPALVLEHPDGATSREKELWRIHLSDFRITGNPKSGSGIECRRINEVFIHGVTVSEHGGDGIRLDHCYEDPRIADNLTGCLSGVP